MTATHKPLSETTISALRAIAGAVLDKPHTYYQEGFFSYPGMDDEQGCVAYQHLKLTRTARQFQNLVKKHHGFGFVCYDTFHQHPFFTATKKDLKLDDEQARFLMGGMECWPVKYRDKYEVATTAKGRARALVNYIEFFIKTDGTCLTARERKLSEAKEKHAEAERDVEQLIAS